MSNVNAGDTAMMTDPANYGRLVHVDQQHADFSFTTHQLVWQCTALQTIRCGSVWGGSRGDQAPGTPIIAYDRQLRPIRDTDGADEVEAIAQRKRPAELTPERQLENAR